MNNDEFQKKLNDVLSNYMDASKIDAFLNLGDQALISKDTFIDAADLNNFFSNLCQKFDIELPYSENEYKISKKLFNINYIRKLLPERQFVFSDVTVGRFRQIVDNKKWPDDLYSIRKINYGIFNSILYPKKIK